jgi:hypothetical protein
LQCCCRLGTFGYSALFPLQLSYIPTNRASACQYIAAPLPTSTNSGDTLVLTDAALADDLKLLHPNESCAFSFVFTEYADLSGKPPGFPQVKWCTSMGEFSIYRGDYTYPRTPASNNSASNNANATGTGLDGLRGIRYECLSAPAEMYVGEEAEIVVRAFNTTSRAMSLHLDCKNTAAPNPQALGGSVKSAAGGGSGMRPRLSTTTHSNAKVLAGGVPSASQRGNDDANSATAAGNANAATTSHRGLSFSGLTFTPLGIVESSDFADVMVNVYATGPGLHDLPTLFLIDSLSGERHPVAAACRILVRDCEEETEEVVEVNSAGESIRNTSTTAQAQGPPVKPPSPEQATDNLSQVTAPPAVPSEIKDDPPMQEMGDVVQAVVSPASAPVDAQLPPAPHCDILDDLAEFPVESPQERKDMGGASDATGTELTYEAPAAEVEVTTELVHSEGEAVGEVDAAPELDFV